MSNPFEISIKLKQHSPIIHFQHHQPGATLRATELKPKLDKYIIEHFEHFFKKNFEKYKQYLVGFKQSEFNKLSNKDQKEYKENYFALDYKVTSTAKLRTKRLYKMIADKKTGVELSDIEIKIFSYNTQLLEIIKNKIKSFFVLTNFGTRQSKGFGCFTTADTTKKEFEKIAQDEFGFIYKKKKTRDAIEEIREEYQLLKSGKNYGGYDKSKFFTYMCDNHHITWEKRKIKETLKANHPAVFAALKYYKKAGFNRIEPCTEPKPESEPDYRYIRALLGLAEHNEYLTERGNKLNLEKVTINIGDPKNEISRFQSPLLFKIFDDTIYVFPKKIPAIMFNRNFAFELEKHFGNGKKDKDTLFRLRTPREDELDMKAFLDYSLLPGWERKPKP